MVRKTDRISGFYRDELRRCGAVYTYSIVHKKTGMKQVEQFRLMYKMFHGSDVHASHKKMIAEGTGAYLCF